MYSVEIWNWKLFVSLTAERSSFVCLFSVVYYLAWAYLYNKVTSYLSVPQISMSKFQIKVLNHCHLVQLVIDPKGIYLPTLEALLGNKGNYLYVFGLQIEMIFVTLNMVHTVLQNPNKFKNHKLKRVCMHPSVQYFNAGCKFLFLSLNQNSPVTRCLTWLWF